MKNRKLLPITLGFLLLFPAVAISQDRNAIRAQAKASAAEIRRQGEPKDRCSVSAFLADGGIVVGALPQSRLVPGDRLISLNGQPVSGKTALEAVAVLRGAGPSAAIPAKVQRGDGELELELLCTNSRPAIDALLRSLDFAADGKFDDCFNALNLRNDLSTNGAAWKLQCAGASRKSASYNQAQLAFDLLRLQVEEARWFAPSRKDLVDRIRASESLITAGLGASKFQEIVAATKSWPGDETLYASTAPDWAVLRRGAESALRARLIDPDSARFDWQYGFALGTWKPIFAKAVEGYWTCGTVNARNRMGGYTGNATFVVVVGPKGEARYVEIGDATRDIDFLRTQCSNSLKFLPPASAQVSVVEQRANSQPSLADELKKLSDLKTSGVLTEAEFETAKARLLAP